MGTRDAALVEAFDDGGNGGGGVFVVHGDADDLRAGKGEGRDLVDGALNVGGVGVGHRLNDDRDLPADLDLPDFDRRRLPALDLRHGFSLPGRRNYGSSFGTGRRDELLKNGDQTRIDLQTLGFLPEQLSGIFGALECISKIGKAQNPQRQVQIPLAFHVVSDPTGIGHPAVLLGESAGDEIVADGAREGNIEVSPEVHVADLGFRESEFAPAKTMRGHRDVGPGCNLLFQAF